MVDDPQPDPDDTPRARLERHRALHLHDAVIDDLNDIWAVDHPGGEQPWETT